MTTPKKPTFLIKADIKEIYKTPKGKDSIKPYLLQSGGFDTIQQAKKEMGGTANDTYEFLLNNWNDYVDRENKQMRNKYINEQVAYDLKQTKIQTKIKREKKVIKKEIIKLERKQKLTEKKIKPDVILIDVVLRVTYVNAGAPPTIKIVNERLGPTVISKTFEKPSKDYYVWKPIDFSNASPEIQESIRLTKINQDEFVVKHKQAYEEGKLYGDNKNKYEFITTIRSEKYKKERKEHDKYKNKLSKQGEFYTDVTFSSMPYSKKISTPESIYTSNILKYIKNHDALKPNPYKVVELLEYTVTPMDKRILDKKYNIKKEKIMMKKGFILKNDWLQYSQGITQDAYTETEDKCVYYQLEKFLLNPPTGNPTKFINKMRTSEEALYKYFNDKNEEEQDFNITSGVSTEMISKLCKDIKRNMYAYDENNKCFYNVTCNDSKNYCPIVFYCMNGHFYLINDPTCMRSVAECNKPTAKKIKSSSLENEKEKKDILEVFHIEKFITADALQMKEGIYILQQSNLETEIIEYITCHNDMVKTQNRGNVVIQFTFKNKKENDVIICVDSNYGKNIDYEKMKNVAVYNDMEYTNEGVGTVIMKILENKTKCGRKTFTAEERQEIIDLFNGICPLCEEEAEKFEIDHIKPLACGGTNEIENLQPLCIECHKQKTKEENELGVYRVNDEVASTFNDTVLQQIFNTSQFKSWQFVEKVNEAIPNMNQFKIDMTKCRRNITYFSKFEYPVYSIMDTPQPFNGIVKCGLFYVKTNNIFPLRGCGWYYEPLVKYALERDLITLENIHYEFIPYKTLQNDYFKKHIDILLNAFSCEPDLQKLSVNAFVGLMGITTRQVCYSKYSLCPYTASAWYVSNNKDVFIKNHHLTNGETLYEGLFSEEVLNETTQYCIYSMVLQMEALELHKIETMVIDNGGIILDRNTDAIRYNKTKEINIEPYFYDDEQTIRKYKPEDPKELHIEHLAHLNRLDISEQFNFTTKWNIEYGYTGSATDKAQEIIDSKKSIHIDGRAGTGKTYLVNEIIEILKKDDIVTEQITTLKDFLKGKGIKKTIISNYMCFSPTNKGARLINGKTIHSVYYKFKHSKSMLFKMLEGKKYIIIDEVSMMVEKFYTLFTMIKRACPHIIFIISGDFGQLPPVKDSWVGDYENSVAMSYLCDGNRLQLTNCMRADNILFNMCKDVEDFNIDDFKPKCQTYLNLAYTHETRISVNKECMERFLIEEQDKYEDTITTKFVPKDKRNKKTQDVTLCAGMPIIAHTTDKKLDILNTDTFVIDGFSQFYHKASKTYLDIIDISTVTEDGKKILPKQISANLFNKYFYLGFCITIHASQGETYKSPYTIYNWNSYHFSNKAKYVALSRATDIQNIQIQP